MTTGLSRPLHLHRWFITIIMHLLHLRTIIMRRLRRAIIMRRLHRAIIMHLLHLRAIIMRLLHHAIMVLIM
jgi:hypothetical protein